MIEIDNLHKAFASRGGRHPRPSTASSFRARDGEITGLLGPNGAGKTTTLRMLYTLMRPDTGRVLVDGIDGGATRRARARSLGVLPDARGIYKRLTARENIAYFGRAARTDDAALIAERIARARRPRSTCRTSSTAAPKATRRDSAPRPRSPARSCTIRATSCSTSRPTGST